MDKEKKKKKHKLSMKMSRINGFNNNWRFRV